MKQTSKDLFFILKGYLNQKDCEHIHALEMECVRFDSVALKLELDYKLEDAAQRPTQAGIGLLNEFMAFDGELLIGYLGICGFGNTTDPLELTGMVHPQYRRMGVFSHLCRLAAAECGRRNAAGMLGLCDRQSSAGQSFLVKIGAEYQYTEYEMYWQNGPSRATEEQTHGIRFRKATNADARDIAQQNKIYFGRGLANETEEMQASDGLLPEEEEKRGMTIYLAEKDGQTVGKVNLQLINGLGGIYGLGVLPVYRGKGYGRAILLMGIEKLKEAGAADILLQVAAGNATALSLYKSCGFAETSVMDYFKL